MRQVLSFFFFLYCFSIHAQQFICFDTIHYYPAGYTIVNSIKCDKLGNLYVVGGYSSYSNSNYQGLFIHKYSPNGNLVWLDTFPATKAPIRTGLAIDTCNNVYISTSGYQGTIKIGATSYPLSDAHIVKYNPSGQLQSVFTKSASVIYSMCADNQGRINVLGYVGSQGFLNRYSLSGQLLSTFLSFGQGDMATDISGRLYTIENSTLFAYNTGGGFDWNLSIPVNSRMCNDNYGYSYINYIDYSNQYTSNLTKYNAQGNHLWTISSQYWGGYAITANNQEVWVGAVYTEPLVCGTRFYRYTSSGVCTYSYTLPGTACETPVDMAMHNSIVYAAVAENEHAEVYLFKYSPIMTNQKKNFKSFSLNIVPNPSSSLFAVSFNPGFNTPITIKVLNTLGKIVYTRSIHNSSEVYEIDLSGFPKGVYILDLSVQNVNETRKLIVE
jgi:hypothetical protein